MRNLATFDHRPSPIPSVAYSQCGLFAATLALGLLMVSTSSHCDAGERMDTAGAGVGSTTFTFHHEHVIGTSLQWTVHAPDRSIAEESEQWILSEIQRMSHALSRYDPSSELSRLPREAGGRATLSTDLARVLCAAERYRISSGGAFDVRASWFEPVNQFHDSESQVPGTSRGQTISSLGVKTEDNSQDRSDGLMFQREQKVQSLKESPYRVEHEKGKHHRLLVLQNSPTTWTLDGIAKGYIIDQIADRVQLQFPQISGGCLNIGGDLRLFGNCSLSVSIDNPFLAHEGAKPLLAWDQSAPLGIATSGSYRRRVENGSSVAHSHLIDPRTGLSAERLASVTVIAATTMDADAMATTISVLGKKAGLEWIESIQNENAACLLVDANGQIHTSSKWNSITGSDVPVEVPSFSTQPQSLTLVSRDSREQVPSGLYVWIELARPTVGSYRRPYLAVWLEDEEGFPVKTGALWLQTDQPGPRWHRDLTRWYRSDRLRKLTEKLDLIETVSSATRGPGKYEVHFDGTDNQGNLLSTGTYTLLIEVAREHGTYQLIRKQFQWDDQPMDRTELEANIEIIKAAFQFQPLKVTGAN